MHAGKPLLRVAGAPDGEVTGMINMLYRIFRLTSGMMEIPPDVDASGLK